MKNIMIAFSLITFLTNTCRLNFTSVCMYFSSFGFSVLMEARIGFQSTVISNSIWGQLPFALPCSFLSFREYHFFSPLRILSNGIATFPRNSTLWSLSSSYTVTSRTELISFTLNVNIFCHDGVRVLYSVCVCRRAFTNSSTQNGSDLPPRSAAASPCARNTFTVRWPTSRRLWRVRRRA